MTSTDALRPVDLARLALGATGVLRPQWLIRGTGSADGTWPRRATRLLGVRYLIHSTAGLALTRRWVPEVDGAVDLVHAASTMGRARAFPDHRRRALTRGAQAQVFAAADLTEKLR
jgi:hypothetical protein